MNSLTNREIATLTLFTPVILIGFFKWKLGPSVISIFLRFLTPKILIPFLFLTLYAYGILYGAYSLGIWDLEILKDTLVLVMLLGFRLLYKAAISNSGIILIREETAKTFQVSVPIAFYMNLANLSILGEILTQSILVVTAMGGFVATEGNRGSERAQRVMNRITTTIGIFYFFFTPYYLEKNRAIEDLPHIFMTLGMSFWLPLSLFPYIYLISVYSAMDSAVMRLRVAAESDQKPKLRFLLAVIWGLHLSSRLARKFDGSWTYRFKGLTKFRETSDLMKEFRKSLELK